MLGALKRVAAVERRGGAGRMLFQREDLGMEVMDWGNQHAAGAARNEQLRPVGVSGLTP